MYPNVNMEFVWYNDYIMDLIRVSVRHIPSLVYKYIQYGYLYTQGWNKYFFVARRCV